MIPARAMGARWEESRAPTYDEVVVDQLYPGNVQLTTTLPFLIEATEKTLELDEAKRRRTILRIDAGGGSMNGINWLLQRGYHVHCKDFSSRRAAHFALSVKQWHQDPKHAERQMGWAVVKSGSYVREVQRVALKWRKKNGQTCHAMLISTLGPADVLGLLGKPMELLDDPAAVLMAYAELYDRRGGAVEIEIKESKQGIGVTKRNKKTYAGQQMVMLLGTLAHNLVIWAKRWLEKSAPKLKKYGVPRMVRDVFQVSGFVEFVKREGIRRIVLNDQSALARQSVKAWRALLKAEQVSIILGKI